LLKSRPAPKPLYDMFPVSVQQRFVSHPNLNHKSMPPSKNILTRLRGFAADNADFEIFWTAKYLIFKM
jgi:hypothetical protein